MKMSVNFENEELILERIILSIRRIELTKSHKYLDNEFWRMIAKDEPERKSV